MNRKDQRALFWIAFLATLAILILSSCTTERKVVKYVEKHPGILDKWTTTDTVTEVRIDTVYEDRIVEIHLPGETKTDSIFIPLPCPEAKKFSSDTLITETSLATGRAWVENGVLYQEIEQHDTTLQVRLDSAYMEINRLESLLIEEITRPPPKKVTPKWAWVTLIIAVFATVLLILDLLYRR